MKCQPVIKAILGVAAILATVMPPRVVASPIARTQLGIYDLAEQTKHIYNLEISPTPGGATATLTRPDNSHFLLSSHLVPCFSPQADKFSDGYIEVKRDKSTDVDNNLLPLISFTNDNNLIFSSKMLSGTRQLVFMEDNTTLVTFDRSSFKMDATGCPKH